MNVTGSNQSASRKTDETFTYLTDAFIQNDNCYSMSEVACLLVVLSVLNNCKLNIFGFWTVDQTKTSHLDLPPNNESN